MRGCRRGHFGRGQLKRRRAAIRAVQWVVANADRFVPFADASFTVVQSITARMNPAEFRRVLRDDGRLLVACRASTICASCAAKDAIGWRGRSQISRRISAWKQQRRVTRQRNWMRSLVQDVRHLIYRPGGSQRQWRSG